MNSSNQSELYKNTTNPYTNDIANFVEALDTNEVSMSRTIKSSKIKNVEQISESNETKSNISRRSTKSRKAEEKKVCTSMCWVHMTESEREAYLEGVGSISVETDEHSINGHA